MRSDKELFKIVTDNREFFAQWVCKKLKICYNPNCVAIGFVNDEKILGAVYISDIRQGRDCFLSIYTEDKRWCTRRSLRAVFDVCFQFLKTKRVTVLVSRRNKKSFDFVKRLGFKKEGFLRRFRDNGDDCFIFGMLKNECKWRSK